MICYPRYKVYELYTQQNNKCFTCACKLNIHDLEITNIIEDHMFCNDCLKSKDDLLSDLEKKESVIDIDIRPITWKMEEENIDTKSQIIKDFDTNHKFTLENYGNYTVDTSYTDEANEQSEIESEIDPEEKIQTSWYHRAKLGDENREIYDDGQDTDFEAVQKKMGRR